MLRISAGGVLCFVLLQIQLSVSQELQVNVTSTESTATVQWNVLSEQDTHYYLKYHRTGGIFTSDLTFDAPFSGSQLTANIEDLYPGVNYSFYIFRNVEDGSGRIYKDSFNTVPLPPENINVMDRGSSSLLLKWESGYNSSQKSHEISYIDDDDVGSSATVSGTEFTEFNLTGLQPGHNYSIVIVATIGNKKSNDSEIFTTITAPGQPLDFVVKAKNTTHLETSWTAGKDSIQDGYSVKFSDPGKEPENTASCDMKSPCVFAPGGLPGHLFTVKVYAHRDNILGIPAVTDHNTAPKPVTTIQGTEGVRNISVSWDPVMHTEFDWYRVEIINTATTVKSIYNVSKDVTSFSKSNLTGGNAYTMHVFTETVTEESAGVTELLVALPEPVLDLKGKGENTTSLAVSWTIPKNTVFKSIRVLVTKSGGAQFNLTYPDTTSEIIIGSLLPGLMYDVTVFVVASARESAGSTGRFGTKPYPPIIESVVAGETDVSVTLVPPVEGMFDYLTIQIQGNNDIRNVSKDSPTAVFTGLSEGTEYVVMAHSVSGQQTSDSVDRIFFTKPRPPTNLELSALNSTTVEVKWGPPDRGSASNYTVTMVPMDGSGQSATITTADLTWTFHDKEAGQTYNVTVVSNLGGIYSEPVVGQVTTTPFPVTRIWVSAKGTDFVAVQWEKPTGTSYDYFMYDLPAANITHKKLPDSHMKETIQNLEPGTDYMIVLYVVSRTASGEDLLSPGTYFNFSTYPTSVATLSKVEVNTTGIHVNWTRPANSFNFDFFYLTLNPNHGPQPNVSRGPSETSWWFVGLEPGQIYNISINTYKQRVAQKTWIIGVPTFLMVATQPLPVYNLTVSPKNTDTIAVQWSASLQSQQDRFIVTYVSSNQTKTQNVLFVVETSVYETSQEQLLSGYTYNISVKAVRDSHDAKSESDETYDTTTTYPQSVLNLVASVSGTTMMLEWKTQTAGSRQDYFQVDYKPVLRDSGAGFTHVNVTQSSLEVMDRYPGEMYKIFVYAVSQGMTSSAQMTNATIPPLPPSNVSVIKEKTTSSSVTVGWKYDSSITFTQTWILRYYNKSFHSPEEEVERSGAQTDYEHTFNNMLPGALYSIDIQSKVEAKLSDKMTVNATVNPVVNTVISEDVQQTTNNTIYFSYTVEEADLFDNFRFSIANSSSIPPVHRPKDSQDRTVSFIGLVGGTMYAVETVTEIRGQTSEPKKDFIRTVPNSVPVMYSPTANTVVITFGELQGNAERYVVQCEKGGSSCWNQEYPVTTPQAIVRNLRPFTQYNIIVSTFAGKKSKSQTLSTKTKSAAPSEVRNVQLEETELRKVRVTWDLPEYLNGILEYYSLSFSGRDPTLNEPVFDNGTKHIDKTQTMYILEGLKAGFLYTVEVQAFTVAIGEAGRHTIQLKADKPVFKSDYDEEKAKPRRDISDGAVTEAQLKLTFANAFSDFNGRVIAYTVIVSTNPALSDTTSLQLPSWKDAQKDSKIVVYQTTGNCTDFFLEGSTCGMPAARRKRASAEKPFRLFTVGADSSCSEQKYCNGPLRAETGYHIKLRAFTTAGFAETEYSEKITTAGSPSNAGGIIGGVIAAIVIAAVIVVVVFIWYRRRQPKRAQKYLGDRRELEEASMAKMSRPIKLVDYGEHVRKMAADSDFRYAEEYEDLKEVGRDQPTLAAEFPPNRPKNRFTNILPYDHSRVKLLPTDDDEGSDYINANYVPGYLSKREYIATQGPLPSTRDDFWRMVWEQNTRNIVMLTKCMEKGREKSDHYWPNDSEPKFYGDLQVCILNETHLPDWTISEFKMSLGDTSRQIRHFHYKAWPDFGVPRDPTSLLRFVRTVREKLFREEGPVVVHCSAGVGRSGTFIVLDHCLQHIKEKDYVDIYGIVYKLRRERVLMVQTEQQYKFIHECILCVLEGREDEATYANVGHVNVGYDGNNSRSSAFVEISFEDDEGINVEVN
ncbi:tyrosine-protein phosphatase 10D-like isoform X2 [Gigantopelta aegis]|uniref:tyrosine-protein phosphatase 10D-like isoform X2 n=1 Tax=Gigantopelta aegis TaxID=1735272 RepID=UPI001B8881F4|nr:tyrosine-protein phosphatase 10D-like isoform X2 [Gigantopelta aegis]